MVRNRFVRAAIALLVLFGASARAQPLAPNPDLVTGELDNGLGYVIQRHTNPPGRIVAWLHVSTGSLNETERQRGIAHFLEHLAFNGSEHFPPGSVVPFFESLGLTFGADQNAFTSFDQTVYQLQLPDNAPETLDKALLFFGDVAGRLSLLPAEIEKERQVILEERRARSGGMQRVMDYIWERWAPGSTFGRRIPIGLEETILGMGRDDFTDYYGRWYVPSNMTLLVVGDVDPPVVVDRVRGALGTGERRDRPADADPGVRAVEEFRAIVGADPEIASARVEILRIGPAGEPVTTTEQARAQLVDELGSLAFGRRMRQKVTEGRVAFQGAGASSGDFARAIRITDMSAFGEPSRWREILDDLARELVRARLHGFGPREIEDARTEMLAGAERAAEVEPTQLSSALIARMNAALADGEPIRSAAQDLELIRSLLPTITPEEVSSAFAARYDPAGVAFVLTTRSDAGVPSEEELVELGRAALAVTPEAEGEAARPTALMAALPAPGRVVELSRHEASGVWSAWFSNNIRVHYRFMDERKDQVTVNITLAGGSIQETPESRGLAEAASVAWERPATSTLSSTNIADLLVGRKVGVSGRAGDDTMGISVSGSPTDLETGLQLAHLMLTDPRLEPAALDQWKERQEQLISFRRLQPELAFADVLVDAVYPPGEVRTRPLTSEQVQRATPETAQAWLHDLIGAAPIEVAIVGDFDRDTAFALAERYLGSLPIRPRIGRSTLDDLRAIKRPAGPIVASKELATATDKAVVLTGFFGPDEERLRDTQLLDVAARVLSTRMIATIREEQQLVYSIGASSSPGVEYPGYGLFLSFSTTAPGKVGALAEAVRSMYADMANQGPTAGELEVAKKQIATSLEQFRREPVYWVRALSMLDYRGRRLGDVVDEPAAYQSATADEVRAAFARYFTPETSVTVWVAPAGTEGGTDRP